MPIQPSPSRWGRLARLDEPHQRRLQREALLRQVRQELAPFSPAFRRALEAAGLEPREFTGPAELARIGPLSRDALARAGPAHVLTLAPGSLRAAWPVGRKLALALGGGRVRAALPRSYRPSLRLETRGRTGEPIAIWSTAFDLELARELGRRNLELLELEPASARVLALVGAGTDLASWHLREALTSASVPSAFAPPPRGERAAVALRAARALHPTAVCGRPADLLRLARAARAAGVGLGALELGLLLAEPADRALRRRVAEELAAAGAPGRLRIASAYGLAELRQLSVECPAPADEPSGHHLFPDTLLAEVEGEPARGGELLLTPLVGHGTAVFRYRTGDRAPAPVSWAPCPACGRGLPRIGPIAARLDEELDLGGGARLDFAALRAALDGRGDLLEWQLLVRRRAEHPAGLLLRIAGLPGTSSASLARELGPLLGPLLGDCPSVPALEIEPHSEQQMLDFLAAPHEMLERRLLDPNAPPSP